MQGLQKTAVQNPLSKDPNAKQYIYLSAQGRRKYAQVAQQAYRIMVIYCAIGVGAGYTCYKFVDYVKNFKRFPRMGRFLFIATAGFFTYHGYKLMEFTKKRGQRAISKDPQYLLTREQYQKCMAESKANQL